MFLLVFCLVLVGAAFSAQARVAVTDETLTEIHDNALDAKTTAPVIKIDLPTSENVNETDNTASDNDKPKDLNITDKNPTNNDKAKEIDTLSTTEQTRICPGEISDNTIDTDDATAPCTPEPNTALILTPLIEENKQDEARKASKVNPVHFLGVESYSGYLTVDKKHDSNLFFWYFPMEKPVNGSPWIIWLQGGPGASSMTGLFDEIGPFRYSLSDGLIRNPYTWLQNHSLVFIDNPVGTGFSFTNHHDGFARDLDTYGNHLYKAVKQLVSLFPELRSAPLYIAGESYAGKYVPAAALRIHRHTAHDRINLKGLIVGNAFIDPSSLPNTAQAFYNFGMLGSKQMKAMQPLLTAFQEDIDHNRSLEAKQKWTHLIYLVLLLTHQKHAYNFLRDELPIGSYINLLGRDEIKRAIHVGEIKFSFVNFTVNERLGGDFLSNAKPLYEELLEHYRVLTYCGQLDQMLPCVSASENSRTWRWSASDEFGNATRYPYIFNRRLAGYQKEGGGLTEALIRGAGHMVPLDTPAAIQHLVARWVNSMPLSQRFGLLEGSFVQEFVRNSMRFKQGQTEMDTDSFVYL